MNPRIRFQIALALKILILTWPLVHIVMSLFFGLNSWKLAGWGMYATNHPFHQGIKIFLLEPGAQPVSEIGPVFGDPRLTVVSAEGGREVDLEAVPQARQIRSQLWSLRVLRWKSKIAGLVETAAEAGAPGRPASRALVLFAEPRLDPFGRRLYSETEVYLYDPGEVSRLGSYSSHDLDEGEIVRRIWDRLPPAASAPPSAG